jgi:hypothetical protein
VSMLGRHAAVLLVLLAWATPSRVAAQALDAPAGDASQARAFFEVGAQAYERGDYSAAVEAFGEAYARVRRPGLLFSMAQAHRRAYLASDDEKHLAGAIAMYRKYLESGDAARRKESEDELAKLVPLAKATENGASAEGPRSAGAKLMVASSTPGAVLKVDGEAAPRLPYVATVTPGVHTVVVSAPGFRDQVRHLPVPDGAALALDVTLVELPAMLAISGTADSQVWLDGRLIGSLPLPPLALKSGKRQLNVQRAGHDVVTKHVTLAPGAVTRLDVPLEITAQRQAARGALALGGASLLAAAITGFAAHARQEDAESLLDARPKRGWSEEEHGRYERLVEGRDRLRSAALGFGAGGLGCMLVGLALFVFDRPEVPALIGEEPSQREPSPRAAPSEIIAGPAWDSDRVGIEARGRF